MDQIFERSQYLIATFGWRIIAAALIFMVGRWVVRITAHIVRALMTRGRTDERLVSFVGHATHIGLLAFVILAALAQLGVETTSLIVILAAVGLATGLALQGALSNFAGGVLIVAFRPFKVGDVVEGAGICGTVEEIELFTTRLLTPDNKLIIVPNGKLMGDNIINYTGLGRRRLDLVYGVANTEDLDRVKQIIQTVLDAESRVFTEPEPMIGVLAINDGRLDLAVRPWVKAEDYWSTFFALNEAMKRSFDAEKITLPNAHASEPTSGS